MLKKNFNFPICKGIKLPEIYKTAKVLVKQNGDCTGVRCSVCPFSHVYNTKRKDCVQMGYKKHATFNDTGFGVLLNSAKTFLELYYDEVEMMKKKQVKK